jgi:hypothetical protein
MDGVLARCTEVVVATAAACCSTRATTCWPPSAPSGAARTMPSAPCTAAWPCWTRASACASACSRGIGQAGCDVRVGVHTGDVLLGGRRRPAGTIRGLTVNIAARMEQTAPRRRAAHQPRHLAARCAACSRSSRSRRCRSRAVDAPLQTYLVRALPPRRFVCPARGIDGRRGTPLIGRDAELALLRGRLAGPTVAAAGARRPRWSASRPRQEPAAGELRRPGCLHAHAPAAVLRHACASPHPAAALRPAARPAGLAPAASPTATALEVAASAWWTGCATPGWQGRGGAGQGRTRIGQLLGMDFADSDARAAACPLAAAAQRPSRAGRVPAGPGGRRAALALLLEDLHWADDGTLDFAGGSWLPARLATRCRWPGGRHRAARTPAGGRRPGLGRQRLPGHRRVVLAALDRGRQARWPALLLALP